MKRIITLICIFSFFETTFSLGVGTTMVLASFANNQTINWLPTVIVLGIHVIPYVGIVGLWLMKRWAYYLMVILFFLRLFQIHWAGQRWHFQYGINLNFDIFFNLKQYGEIGFSINAVSIFLLGLLLSIKSSYFLASRKEHSVDQ